MTWNYRIVRRKFATKPPYTHYGIHEAYYDKNKKIPYAVTAASVDVSSDSLKGCLEVYEMMAEAFAAPVLNYEDIKDEASGKEYIKKAVGKRTHATIKKRKQAKKVKR